MKNTNGRKGTQFRVLDRSSPMDGFGPTHNCPKNMPTKLWTLAVFWMVLGPDRISKTTKLMDISSFMDGFWPIENNYNKLLDLSRFMDNFGPYKINVLKTKDLGSSMDYFSLRSKFCPPVCSSLLNSLIFQKKKARLRCKNQ